MSSDIQNPARNLVLGALVADAAAMGLHWIYDQDHIQDIAPQRPEFVGPVPEHFEGVPAFFAHAARRSGEQTQYGEQALVMARALAQNEGIYNASVYATHFRSHFGYGGTYVGYIDGATRGSLDNFQSAENALIARAKEIPFDGHPRFAAAMVHKANFARSQFDESTIRAEFEKSVRIMEDDDALVAFGFQVLDLVLATPPVYGAVDEQLPAVAKLPALIAVQSVAAVEDEAFLQSVESAVRTTSDHSRSIAYGAVCAKMMQAAMAGADVAAVISAGQAVANEEISAALAEALSMAGQSNLDVTKHFGMACDLKMAVPSLVHNLATSADYQTAIRRNIYAGGDSCGRGIVLGAIAGAVYGVGGERGIPQDWLDKLAARSEADALLAKLFPDIA